MSRPRTPGSLAQEALVVLAVGLAVLTVAAIELYRPGAPAWTHTVVNGVGWALVLTTGAMLLRAGIEKLVELGRRHLSG
ncbi:MAG: hypothetical protein ABWX57_01705 [Aeromicrobium sp.]